MDCCRSNTTGSSTPLNAVQAALTLNAASDVDPVELRLRNYAEADPESGKPWSSKYLRECYDDASNRFGWARRPPPGSMRDGNSLIGWGMATATYPANRMVANASATMLPDGTVRVRSGSQDIGTGTYTVMTQVAAEALGMPVERIRFELGDTTFPEAPVSGGSMTAASVSPAVQAACHALRGRIIAIGVADPQSTFQGADATTVSIDDGWLHAGGRERETVGAVIGRHGKPVEANAQAKPGDEKLQYALHSFGAVFVEVAVDRDVGQIRVPRIVATYDVGRLLNAKTARSQLQGGLVWGVSLALMEHTVLDLRTGRFVNANLAEYHVPVNADIQELAVNFVGRPDTRFNPPGARGIGEIGITGVGGAICNAVYHATGRRVRDLPITLDALPV
jgi:xanthine dehydrogenase YagR molybdenum-binding subunit